MGRGEHSTPRPSGAQQSESTSQNVEKQRNWDHKPWLVKCDSGGKAPRKDSPREPSPGRFLLPSHQEPRPPGAARSPPGGIGAGAGAQRTGRGLRGALGTGGRLGTGMGAAMGGSPVQPQAGWGIPEPITGQRGRVGWVAPSRGLGRKGWQSQTSRALGWCSWGAQSRETGGPRTVGGGWEGCGGTRPSWSAGSPDTEEEEDDGHGSVSD